MREILKYAAANRSFNKNYFIKRSLEKEFNEDKTIKIISKEVTDLIIKLFLNK